MVFRLIVERQGRSQEEAGEPPNLPHGSSSVFETFLGADGELVAPQRSAPEEAPGSDALGVSELDVSRVRLFRMGSGVGGLDGVGVGRGMGGLAAHSSSGLATFEGALPAQRTSALLLLAVPVELSLTGLRRFFGPSLEEDVETLRILRWAEQLGDRSRAGDEDPPEGLTGDFYAVVLLCRTQEAADALYQKHHGRILCEGRQSVSGYGFAPSSCMVEDAVGGPCCYLLFLEGVAYRGAVDDTLGAKLEVPKVAVELPMCPFCLERLDVSVTGMITHNAGWLSSMEWDEVPHSRCCAACAAIYMAGPLEGSEAAAGAVCKRCSSAENLWVCLVCGHLGCGRYAQGHAKDHAYEEGHHFCLDLSSGRIWHYAADVFVHRRLVQMAAASGRFEVALPEPADEGGAAGSAARSSMEGSSKAPGALREGQLAMELDAVLASQLDYQRSLYEAKLRALDEQHQRALAEVLAQTEAQETRRCALEAELLEAQHRRSRLEQRSARAQAARGKASEEVEFAKELNRSLLANRAEIKRASASGSGKNADAGPPASTVEDDPMICRLRKQVAKLMDQVSEDG